MAAHLKDALVLTLDDVQLWLVDGLDGALDRLERLSDAVRTSQAGRAAASGLDDVLSRLEEANAHYLPLPPTLREYGSHICGPGPEGPTAGWCVIVRSGVGAEGPGVRG